MSELSPELRAVRQLRKAAADLTAACLEHMRVPSPVLPIVKFYDDTIIEQDAPVDMAVLLGKIH